MSFVASDDTTISIETTIVEDITTTTSTGDVTTTSTCIDKKPTPPIERRARELRRT
jgi:hypothetical protein